jgi:MFS family permease
VDWIFILPLLVAGLGNGFFLAPNIQFIVATVDDSEAGAASGVINTMQRIGSAIGIAIIGSILFGSLVITSHPPTANDVAVAFSHSSMLAMGMSTILAFVAFLLIFALPKTVSQRAANQVAIPD